MATAQDLINTVNDRLMGYQGVATDLQILDFLQEAQDEVWVALKTLMKDYFGETSQNTDPTKINYFPKMTKAVRQYTLPANLRAIRFFEPTDQKFAQVLFHYATVDDPEWRTARMAANVDQTNSGNTEYFYTVFGKDQLFLAQFLEEDMNVKLYYIRTLVDLLLFNTGTATFSSAGTDVTLNGTAYTVAQMASMVGLHFYVAGVDYGLITAANSGTQHLTLHDATPAAGTAVAYSVTQDIDQLVDPYNEKIADFAVHKILLAAQDQAQFESWLKVWRADLLTLQTAASPRNEADPTFAQDFNG